jgi:hypothetical protein
VEFVVKLKGLNIEAIRRSYIDIACPEEMIFSFYLATEV